MKILEDVKQIVAKILEIEVDGLDENADMVDVEGWDSMHNVLILSAIEDHYEIMFPEDDIFDLVSVKALAEEVEKLKK